MAYISLGSITFLDTSNEGTSFALAFPSVYIPGYHPQLIINARQTTEVAIRTRTQGEIVTVHGNWSLHYDIDADLRTTFDIEDKGNPQLGGFMIE